MEWLGEQLEDEDAFKGPLRASTPVETFYDTEACRTSTCGQEKEEDVYRRSSSREEEARPLQQQQQQQRQGSKSKKRCCNWKCCLCCISKCILFTVLYIILLISMLLNLFFTLASFHPSACDLKLAMRNNSDVCQHLSLFLPQDE